MDQQGINAQYARLEEGILRRGKEVLSEGQFILGRQGEELERLTTDTAYLAEYLSQNSGSTAGRTVSFSAMKKEGQWVLQLDGTVLDAMLGGVVSTLSQLLG